MFEESIEFDINIKSPKVLEEIVGRNKFDANSKLQ